MGREYENREHRIKFLLGGLTGRSNDEVNFYDKLENLKVELISLITIGM